ncbi:MAG: hypothetical protein V3U97_01245 [bacterium]
MNKGIIKRIGIVVVELVGNRRRRVVKFWVIDECSKPYIDGGLLGGYSVKELKQIVKARDTLSKLDMLDKPVRITIPPGRYALGIFNVPFSTGAG